MKLLKFLILIFLVTSLFAYYLIASCTVNKQEFVIWPGDTVMSIREKLHIDINPYLYRLAAKLWYDGKVLQAGTYHIDTTTSLRDFLNRTLWTPVNKDISITILPGWSVFDIDESLSSQGIVDSGALIAIAENIPTDFRESFPFLTKASSLEWFLLPDTYRIKPNSTAKDIVQTLLVEFNKKIYDRFSFSSQKAFYETLIFASILEKEEKSSVNKPIVAWVLEKRYHENQPLGADATVCYHYRLTMNDCTPSFIGEHIGEQTPYNTRRSTSLPPTPISNPSPETFAAAANPESSPYYYYLHDNSGEIHYGRTLDEHNRNRVLYLGK